MKTLREMMDLVEAAQQPVAEGWTKLPSGDYQNSYTGVRSSKPPVKKKRGEKTGAEWDAIEKAKKDKESGVAEGTEQAWAVTGTWTQRKYMREPMTTTTKVIASSPEEAMRKYKSYMWNELERKVIDMKVKPYVDQAITGPFQGVAEEQLEETTPEAIARINKLAQQ